MQINSKVDNFLNIICSKIRYVPIRKDISEEIRTHIDDLKESYILEGNNNELAEEKAIKDMGDPETIGNSLNKIHKPKLDVKLFFTVIILIFIGIIVTYSLSSTIYEKYYWDSKGIIKNISINVIALLLGIGVYFFNYTKLKKNSGIIYIISSILGLLSLSSNKYIDIPSFSIMFPAVNLIVPLFIISFAGFVNNFQLNRKNDIVLLGLLASVSLYIISICDNILYLFILFISYILIFCFHIFRMNLYSRKFKEVTLYILTYSFLLIIALFTLTSYPYKIKAIYDIIEPEYKSSYEIQTNYKRNVINNARIFGNANINENFYNDITYKEAAYGLLNAEETDIFCYIIAQYGIFPASIVALLVIILIIKIISNVKYVKDQYGKCIIVGLGSMLIINAILNLLGNLCLININSAFLPFVSYSGFINVINIIIMALILSIYRRKDIIVIKENKVVS